MTLNLPREGKGVRSPAARPQIQQSWAATKVPSPLKSVPAQSGGDGRPQSGRGRGIRPCAEESGVLWHSDRT
jgi:hypothetical protein